MADEVDIERLNSGELDLSGCDFRNADLSNRELRGRNFKNSQFKGAILNNSDFSDCNFEGAFLTSMKAIGAIFDRATIRFLANSDFSDVSLRGADLIYSNIQHVNLSNADLRAADFKLGNFDEGCVFDGAVADNNTNFDGVSVSRSAARKDVFRGYDYVEGKLKRSSEETPEFNQVPPKETRNHGKILRRLNDAPAEIGAMALSLAVLAEQEIEREERAKPNDPLELSRWEAYHNFLHQLAEGLRKLQTSLEMSATETLSPDRYNSSAAIVSGLRSTITEWFKANSPTVVDGAARIALIGAGTSFLAWCGAPVEGAFGVASILTGGAKVAEIVSGAIKQAKGKSD